MALVLRPENPAAISATTSPLALPSPSPPALESAQDHPLSTPSVTVDRRRYACIYDSATDLRLEQLRLRFSEPQTGVEEEVYDESWWKDFAPPRELALDLLGEEEGVSDEVRAIVRDVIRRTVWDVERRRWVDEEEDEGVPHAAEIEQTEEEEEEEEDDTRDSEVAAETAEALALGPIQAEEDAEEEVVERGEKMAIAMVEKSAAKPEWKLVGKQLGAGLAVVRRGSGTMVLSKARGQFGRVLKSCFRDGTECVSCFEEHRTIRTIQLPCSHSYCLPCARKLILTAIQDEAHFPPKCCITEIPRPLIRRALFFPQYLRYRHRERELATPVEDRIYCPHRRCGAFMERRAFPAEVTQFPCLRCFRWICRYCKGKAHGGGKVTECPNDNNLQALFEAAERRGWRRCYKCKALVELSSGCDHMRCRCKAEFCYQCGLRWKTCACEIGVDRDEDEHHARQRAFDEADTLAMGLAPAVDNTMPHLHESDSEIEYDSEIDDDIRAAFAASRASHRAERQRRNREHGAALATAQREARRRRRQTLKNLETLYSRAERELGRVHELQRGMMQVRHVTDAVAVETEYLREREKVRKAWARDLEKCNKTVTGLLKSQLGDEYEQAFENSFQKLGDEAERLKREMEVLEREVVGRKEGKLALARRTRMAEEVWFDVVFERRLERLSKARRDREQEIAVWVEGQLAWGPRVPEEAGARHLDLDNEEFWGQGDAARGVGDEGYMLRRWERAEMFQRRDDAGRREMPWMPFLTTLREGENFRRARAAR